MIETKKYKIGALAKDLGIKNKELVDTLKAIGMENKNQSSSLEEGEFNVLLDKLSAAKQVKNLDDYIDGKAKISKVVPVKEQPAAKPAKEEPKHAAEPKQPEVKQPEAKQPETKHPEVKQPETKQPEVKQPEAKQPEAKQPEAKQPEAKQPEVRQPAHTDNRQQGKNRFENRPDFSAKDPKKANQQKKQEKPQPEAKKPELRQPEKQGQGSITVTTEGGAENRKKARVVDTRGSGAVDLSKYDEKLQNFVPESDSEFNDKQKLKKQSGNTQRQNSQQGGKNGAQQSGNKGSGFDREARAKFVNSKNGGNQNKGRNAEKESQKKQPLTVSIPSDGIVVSEFAQMMKVTASEIVKRLIMLGVMANLNQTIDFDTASLVAEEMGAIVNKEVKVTIEEKLFDEEEDSPENLVPRAPVVCVMGHVDHGKTSILDAIRHTSVTAGEAGGITQHIGAYRVQINGQDITFLDTPGHEAFTAMRARGAKATDIAILVVAADDGIMPQTVEAINHAKAAGLDIVVAINKMDKPSAQPENIKQQLTQYDLVPEEWGGDVICCPVSALTKKGIDHLLESVLLVAEMKDLKANPNRRAKGIVIEAKLDKGRGPVATVLVQNGTLHNGDTIIAGTAVGRVRAMLNDKHQNVKQALPSEPVEIIGLSEVPNSGDEFAVVEDERMARELADQRKAKAKEEVFSASGKVSLDDLFAQISDGAKDLNVIVKADVVGSVEAVKQALLKLSNDEVKINIIHTAVGGIIESDVMLAAASNAIIVGFNVRPDKSAIDSAERQSVDIRTYRVIYDCIDEITKAMKGMLAPTFREQVIGHVQVRQTIHVPNVGTIAGSYVTDGKITRKAKLRVLRDSVVLAEDEIASLRRFKDDVREVTEGYECGIGLAKFNDLRENDVFEVYEMVEIER